MFDPIILKKHLDEAVLLLRCLIEMRANRNEQLNLALMRRWVSTLETEFLPPILQDELYRMYQTLGAMARANRFSAQEIGLVHSILKICGHYDDVEKLHRERD